MFISVRKAFFLILATGIFFAGIPLSYAGSFGSSPPFLNADHLVPGANYTQTIYLVQDQPNSDLSIHAQLTVPDSVRSWIAIDKGFDFTIPQGTRQFPVVVTVAVPQGAGLGRYSGTLVFTTAPDKSGQVTIALGTSIAVNLTVGNDVFEKYSVPLVSFATIEEGWNPRAIVKFENDGNIPESFDSATFDLYDQYDAVRLAYITKQSGFPETPPFTTQQYTIEFPTDFHLGIGQYWGLVTFYKGQQVVASQKTIFNVVAAGSLIGPLGSALYSAQRSAWLMPAAIIILILILIAGIWFYRRRRSHGILS